MVIALFVSISSIMVREVEWGFLWEREKKKTHTMAGMEEEGGGGGARRRHPPPERK